MTGVRSWLTLLGLVALATILVLLRGVGSPQDSPEHSSSSDAANGTSALRLYAQALGRPVSQLEGTYSLPDQPGLMFLFTPTLPFLPSEAEQVRGWISTGGVLVYASEESDPELERQLNIQRLAPASPTEAHPPAPLLGGVQRIAGGGVPVRLLASNADQVPLLRGTEGAILALVMPLGAGRVVVLADPLEVCNAYLDQLDNGRMAADLIGLTPGGGSILFDEFHHGLAARAAPATGWLNTRWGQALAWAVVVVFAGFALRGRAFGPLIPLSSGRQRSAAEYASAVGSLLRRAGGRELTLQALDSAARRALAERVGLGSRLPAADFSALFSQRAPQAGRELEIAERAMGVGASSERSLLEAARRLHALAYPTATTPHNKERS